MAIQVTCSPLTGTKGYSVCCFDAKKLWHILRTVTTPFPFLSSEQVEKMLRCSDERFFQHTDFSTSSFIDDQIFGHENIHGSGRNIKKYSKVQIHKTRYQELTIVLVITWTGSQFQESLRHVKVPFCIGHALTLTYS